MPTPTPNQKRTMWVYIIILILVIFVIWVFFFKKQMKRSLEVVNNQNRSLGGILIDFKDNVQTGSFLLDKMGDEVKSLKEINKVTDEQVNSLATKAEEALHQKRIIDWYEHEVESNSAGEAFKFKYPPAWRVGSLDNIIILTSYLPESSLLPQDRAVISFELKDNPDELSVDEWLEKPSFAPAGATEDQGSELEIQYFAHNNQILEVTIEIIGDEESKLREMTDDVLMTVELN